MVHGNRTSRAKMLVEQQQPCAAFEKRNSYIGMQSACNTRPRRLPGDKWQYM